MLIKCCLERVDKWVQVTLVLYCIYVGTREGWCGWCIWWCREIIIRTHLCELRSVYTIFPRYLLLFQIIIIIISGLKFNHLASDKFLNISIKSNFRPVLGLILLAFGRLQYRLKYALRNPYGVMACLRYADISYIKPRTLQILLRCATASVL